MVKYFNVQHFHKDVIEELMQRDQAYDFAISFTPQQEDGNYLVVSDNEEVSDIIEDLEYFTSMTKEDLMVKFHAKGDYKIFGNRNLIQ